MFDDTLKQTDNDGYKILILLRTLSNECESADISIYSNETIKEMKDTINNNNRKTLEIMDDIWLIKVAKFLTICSDECESADISIMANEMKVKILNTLSTRFNY